MAQRSLSRTPFGIASYYSSLIFMILDYDLQIIFIDNHIRSYDARYNMNPFICVFIIKETHIIIVSDEL